MGKKRARIAARSRSPSLAPLGAEAKKKQRKSREEVQLEEAVFGFTAKEDDGEQPKVRAGKGKVVEQDNGLGHVADQDLFMVDVPSRPAPAADALDEGSEPEDDDDDDDDVDVVVQSASTGPKKGPAWHDPSDSHVSVSLATGPSRLRKLRASAAEDSISGHEYEGRLRAQFERMNPAPTWVSKARRSIHEGRAAWADEDEDEDDGVEDVLRTTRTGKSRKGKAPAVGSLPAGELEVARLRDANQSDPTPGGPGPISSVDFHPSLSPILLTSSSSSRTLALFRLQGSAHPHLHSFHVPDLPITKAAFEPSSGKTVFLGGQRPFFYSVDLGSQKCVRSSPRGLMGVGMGGDADLGSAGRGASFETFGFAPDGKMVAVAGRNGYVHLLEWTGASSQVVASVKANATVKGLAWRRGGAELLTVGQDAEVGVWDVGERRCVGRWKDEGGFGTCAMATDRWDKWTVVGSRTGVVNLYDDAGWGGSEAEGGERKTRRAIENLVTGVSTMRFNSDSQILGLASRAKKDALKLVHLPTATVFSNWPTSGTPLGHVTDLAFSRASEHLAVANARGKVLLYSLGHWAKQR